ncbi:Ribosomal protein S18 acetylase RimI [Deinococcus reticulitermitis]|uniref:Ribosomal protein S18 acetylase RimI n=1 Tax=Deinococcus reticulitermitis TaxID=856736 RepID=A0A1H7C0T3_9DEIO|nr:GNAT family N-acetyltransferase [Deinococcus reticulitermitis]SEJ83066.1 Ribosomal protein S18 acetylase RimI [Deinococcus reticulitermitis]
MIRPMQATDLPDLLALLHWMDAAPEREVLAPDARDLAELRLECEDTPALVDEGPDGVRAYCSLAPFRDGLALEGPLSERGADLRRLLRRAAEQAEGLPVYAFCARDNVEVRAALEEAGFMPMHTTDFYSVPLGALKGSRGADPVPPGYTVTHTLGLTDYRALYRAAEDAWSARLEWEPEVYDAHFSRDDVRLIALQDPSGRAVAFAELEFNPAEARADLTHLAVHPAERGQRLGRALLLLAAAEARRFPELRTLRVRAHDHMKAARALYARAGLTHCRAVVTYLRDGEEEA